MAATVDEDRGADGGRVNWECVGERGPVLWLATWCIQDEWTGGLMDGPGLESSWRAVRQDAGGGLQSP